MVWVALFQGVGPYNPRDAATSLCKNKQWVWSQVNQRAGAYRLSCWGILLLAVKLKQLCRGRGASKTSLLQTVQPVCVFKLRTKSWNTLKVYEYTSYFGDSCLAISFLWLSQRYSKQLRGNKTVILFIYFKGKNMDRFWAGYCVSAFIKWTKNS